MHIQYSYGIMKEKGSDKMKKRVTFTLDEKTINLLKSTSEKTMIPQARIVEQAIIEYINKMKSAK